MENQLLKYLALVKTVETGSFTRAAQALNYAQSSVSTQGAAVGGVLAARTRKS